MFDSSVFFLSSILFILYRLKRNKQQQDQEQAKKSSDPEADYNKEKRSFDQLFLREGTNTNIDYGDDQEQDVENTWKSRVLFQNTVQGNVIMYYDMYKMAFVYYSDMQISYKWLNYCAMKYVRIYFCRDYFLDDSYLPATFENPFNLKKKKEEEAEVQKKEDKKKTMDIDFQSDVFLKRRTETSTTATKKTPTPSQPNNVAEKYVNHFRYMGKIVNYSFLQIPKKVEKVSKKNYQYSDFKKKLKQEKQEDESHLQFLRSRSGNDWG